MKTKSHSDLAAAAIQFVSNFLASHRSTQFLMEYNQEFMFSEVNKDEDSDEDMDDD